VPHNPTIALVTGANNGIGRAIAQRLAETGMTVLIAAPAARRGGDAAAALRVVGAHPVVLDVTAPATIEAAAGRQTVGVRSRPPAFARAQSARLAWWEAIGAGAAGTSPAGASWAGRRQESAVDLSIPGLPVRRANKSGPAAGRHGS
jgi:uncharacterized protein YbjT (DUF2867 family)